RNGSGSAAAWKRFDDEWRFQNQNYNEENKNNGYYQPVLQGCLGTDLHASQISRTLSLSAGMVITCFQSSRKIRGLFCSIAFIAPSDSGKPANPKMIASSVRMWPRQKSSAACLGTPIATAVSIASRNTVMQVAIVDSTTAGSRMAICSTVTRCMRRIGANI